MAEISWELFQDQVSRCALCGLVHSATHKVPGQGDQHSPLMFIGEGPGQTEDEQGLAFVGAAGQLLTKMLAAIRIPREKVYIANIVKCRPPKNRDPLSTEQEACMGWLREQIAIVKPKIIVCLGRISAMALIRSDFKISKEHGVVYEKDGIKYMALYHPAALLRDPRRRPETFVDLKELQRTILERCEHTQIDSVRVD